MSDTPKILIVDDEPRICESLQALLSTYGYEIRTAHSGKKAIEHLNTGNFDLVLLDVVMPDMDGYQVMDYIGRESPDTLVIILTGQYSVDSAVEALRRGANDYLTKPLDTEELLRTVEYSLQNKRLKSECKKAEEALQESEERYRTLIDDVLDRSSVAIVILDSEFRVVWVNRSLETYFGLSREALIGKDKRQLIRNQIKFVFKEPGAFCDKILAAYADNSYIEKFECQVRPAAGREERWLEHWSQPIRSGLYKGGRIEQYADISANKRADEESRKSREKLRQLSILVQSAVERERTSIARDIHDDLGQTLSALRTDLTWLGKRLPGNQKPLIEKNETTLKLADRAIHSVKRIITDLRPSLLGDIGLAAAIEWQAGEFQNRTDIKCQLGISPGNLDLDQERAMAIFRILQEALTNVARHANARNVDINLREKDGEVVLKVRDDGKGMTQEEISHPESFGLLGIRERANVFGGRMEISGARDRGTTVTVSIPVAS